MTHIADTEIAVLRADIAALALRCAAIADQNAAILAALAEIKGGGPARSSSFVGKRG